MQTDAMTAMLQEYGWEEVQQGVKELFPQWQFSVEDILVSLMQGDLQSCFALLRTGLADQLQQEWGGFRSVLISLLFVGLVSALLANVADIFHNKQIADVGFYFAYLFMVMLLFQCFEEAAGTLRTLAEGTVLFMKLFLPTYFMAVGLAAGGVTAGVFYEVLLCLIYLVQAGISALVLPVIYAYVFLNTVNGLWMEERLLLIMEGLKKGVKFLLKAVTTAVMGFSLIQSMVTPVIDSLKGAAIQKAVSVIPGLGGLAGGVSEMMVGSAVLIKNSVGSCVLLLLAVFCLAPLCRLLGIAVLLKGAAALMGIAADKRMTACTDRMGEGCLLLFQTAASVLILFVITIAIISYTTNRGF